MNRPRRVLYVLNHKTAMPFEVAILRSMGFEVYIPKVTPNDKITFRSGVEAGDEEDRGLSIDADTLAYLNKVNFYEELPERARRIVNAEFDVVFAIAAPTIFFQYLLFFRGVLMYRAYGLDNDSRYSAHFDAMIGPRWQHAVEAAGDRFFFAQIFPNLVEVEQPTFRARALTLPLGLPESYFAGRGTWRGTDPLLVLLAIDVMHVGYYRDTYERFRRDFGELFDYRVIGQQHLRPRDARVLGYVEDEAFGSLMRNARAYLYPSQERRHLHYTPVEAMVTGMPVVFHEDGALSQFFSQRAPGAYATVAEGREKLRALLGGDRRLAARICASQEEVLEKMTLEWCAARWRDAFSRQVEPTLQRLAQEDPAAWSPIEAVPARAAAFSWLHCYDFPGKLVTPGSATADAIEERASAFFDGIDLEGTHWLDIGEGEGAYALHVLRGGARRAMVHAIDQDQFRKVQLVRDALRLSFLDTELGSLGGLAARIAALGSHGAGLDWILIHGVCNFVPDIVEVARTAAQFARRGVIMEFWRGGLLDDPGHAMLRMTSAEERAEGWPPIQLTAHALLGALEPAWEYEHALVPTPSSHDQRVVLRMERRRAARR